MPIRILEHESRVLKGNPLGDPARRELWVYLPPGAEKGARRYPVLWHLIGFTGTGQMAVTGNRWALTGLGALLTCWGAYTVYLLLRDPDELTRTENHPSWRHMYLMMMAAQIGFAAAYLIPHGQ